MMSDVISCKNKITGEEKCVKEFRVTGNVNNPNIKMIMTKIMPFIEMRVKVIYSFKPVIYGDGAEIKPYRKTLES